jgi:hypothetical protein
MRLGIAVALLVGLTGCFSTVPKQTYLHENLAPRAGFDLACPANQLAFTDLGPRATQYARSGNDGVIIEDLAAQQGVTGCGKRATYVLVQGQWVLNADTNASEQPRAAPAAN